MILNILYRYVKEISMRKLVFPTVSRYPSDSAPSPWPPFL